MNVLEKLVKECEEIGDGPFTDIPPGFLEDMEISAEQVTKSQRQLLTLWERKSVEAKRLGAKVDQLMEEDDRAKAFPMTADTIWLAFELKTIEDVIGKSIMLEEDELPSNILRRCTEVGNGPFAPSTGKFEEGDKLLGEMTLFQKQLWTLAGQVRQEARATLDKIEELMKSPGNEEEIKRLFDQMPKFRGRMELYYQEIFWFDVCSHFHVWGLDKLEGTAAYQMVLKAESISRRSSRLSRFMAEWSQP
ncbi:hypothetical protein IH981_01330 [Patescibacteria group bacterium]|nr:hypothetical protein [Patescibacteria group bacterium]